MPLVRGRPAARSSRRITSRRRPGSRSSEPAAHAVDAAIATNAVLGVVLPSRLRHRRRRVLADLGRGGRAPDGAQRLRAVAGGGRRGGPPRRRPRRRCPTAGRSRSPCPGAVRSWGDAHARLRAAVAGRRPRAGDRAGARRLPGLGRVHLARSSGRCRAIVDALGARLPGSSRSTGRTAGRGGPASASACRRSRRRSSGSPTSGSTTSTTARSRSARPAALGGRRLGDHDAATCAAHTSTWTEPIATDYRGVRVTTHPPNSSGIVALELLNILEQFEPPPAGGVRPDGVDATPRWIHLGIEASKLAMADRDAHLTDPELRRRPGRPAALARPTPPSSPGGSTRRARRCRPPRPRAARRRDDLPRDGRRRRQRGQPDRVELHGLRVGRRRSRDRDPLPEPRLVLQPRPGRIRTSSRPASGRSTRCCPGCCSGPASGGRGSSPARWAATPSRRSTPRSCRPSSTAASTSRPRSARRAGSSSRPSTSRRRSTSAPSRASAPGVLDALEALGHPVTPDGPVRRRARPRPRDRARRRRPGGGRRLARGRHRPAERRSPAVW